MDVKTIRDLDGEMFEGSVIKNVKKVGKNYKGLWCSRGGSYTVQVPIDACEEYVKQEETGEYRKAFDEVFEKMFGKKIK